MKTTKFKVFSGETFVGEFSKEEIDAAIANGEKIKEVKDPKGKDDPEYHLDENSHIVFPVIDEHGKNIQAVSIPVGKADATLEPSLNEKRITGFVKKVIPEAPDAAQSKTVVTHTIKFTVDTFITVETDNTSKEEAIAKAVEKFNEVIDPAKHARYDGNKIEIIK